MERLFSRKSFKKRQLTLITCAIIVGGGAEIPLATRFPETLLVLILRIALEARFKWELSIFRDESVRGYTLSE